MLSFNSPSFSLNYHLQCHFSPISVLSQFYRSISFDSTLELLPGMIRCPTGANYAYFLDTWYGSMFQYPFPQAQLQARLIAGESI